ncbi:MAG: HAD family hydrolase [Firmicutes bacterium]|nr:HAD family hydrolase [Bacillota bacterium]
MDVRVLLFDLDDTLIEVEMEPFLREYFGMLAARFARVCDPAVFARRLLESTEAMVVSLDGTKTNRDVFVEDFFPKIGANPSDWLSEIDEFYRSDFPKLRKFCTPDPLAPVVVQSAVREGYRTVLATNPVYPRAAVLHRLAWGGLDPGLFELITSYETMHYCKPRPEYYREICSVMSCSPGECLMVGNDVDEDLVAADVGMKTFLVNRKVRNRGSRRYTAHYEGSLEDLLAKIERREL